MIYLILPYEKSGYHVEHINTEYGMSHRISVFITQRELSSLTAKDADDHIWQKLKQAGIPMKDRHSNFLDIEYGVISVTKDPNTEMRTFEWRDSTWAP